VRYEQVNAMLLNEFLKEHRKVEEQSREILEQRAAITELKSSVDQQRKGMEVLTAQLREQGAQIQKVSAQLEASKPAPQVVNNPWSAPTPNKTAAFHNQPSRFTVWRLSVSRVTLTTYLNTRVLVHFHHVASFVALPWQSASPLAAI
jgi:septal ring factor EnvC (AmiA/AmiB activator)